MKNTNNSQKKTTEENHRRNPRKKITEDDFKGVSRVVVQRYIKNPHLIKGKKYDLRLYVAATSACPMRIFLHQQGYARFCSEAYDLDRYVDKCVLEGGAGGG